MTGTCDDCAYNVYDDEMDEYVCEAYLDEDEFYRLMQTGKSCPYYRSGDDYELVLPPELRRNPDDDRT